MPTACIILLRKSVEFLEFCTGVFVSVVWPIVIGVLVFEIVFSNGGDVGGFFGDTSLI